MPNVWAILINYGHPELTCACIQSLQKTNDEFLHILVVDNASPDDSCKVLEQEFGDTITLLRAEENNGFSAGNNIGIRYALARGADYILMLNNDTVVAPSMIDELLKEADADTVTVPKMYYYDEPDKIWYSGGAIRQHTGRSIHFCTEREKGYVTYATGCCMLIPASVINKVGPWDETFFLYGEDLDYSIRLQKANIKILYVPAAVLWHKVSGASGKNAKMPVYYGSRNRFLVLKKHGFAWPAWFAALTAVLWHSVAGAICGNADRFAWEGARAYFAGERGKSRR